MTTSIKLALCAVILALTIAGPAEAGVRKQRIFKQQQIVWIPLFLGVGY